MGGDVLQCSFVERGGEQGAQTVTRQIGCKVKDGRWGDGVEMTLCNLGVSKCRIEQVQLSLPREMNLRTYQNLSQGSSEPGNAMSLLFEGLAV